MHENRPAAIHAVLYLDVFSTQTASSPIKTVDAIDLVQSVSTLRKHLVFLDFEPSDTILQTSPTGVWAMVAVAESDEYAQDVCIRLLHTAARTVATPPGQTTRVLVRAGLSLGMVQTLDLDGSCCQVGTPLEEAEHLAESARVGQILVTPAFQSQIPSLNSLFMAHGRQAGLASRKTCDQFEFQIGNRPVRAYDRLMNVVEAFSVYGSVWVERTSLEYGDPHTPTSDWHVDIVPPLLTATQEGLVKLLPLELMLRYSKVAFVGRTNKSLPTILRDSIEAVELATRWECLDVFYLADRALEGTICTNISETSRENLRDVKTEKEDSIAALTQLAKEHADLSLRVFEFEHPFYFASYWDWDRPGGRIHVSPYVFGQAIGKCPGVDYLWQGRLKTPAFEYYVRGLEFLQKNATRIGGHR